MTMLAPGEYKGGGEYLFDYCPNCGKEKHFYWNVFKKVGQCKVCGYTPHHVIPGVEDMTEWTPREVSVHKDMVGHRFQSPWIDTDTRQYLKSKGVTLNQVKAFGIKHNISRNCLEVPVSPVAPEFPPTTLVRFHRSYGSKWMPNEGFSKLNYMFNLNCLQNRKSVLVCEGIFDILSTKLESHSVALLGTQITDRMLDILSNYKVYTWFDWDSAGKKAAEEMQRYGDVWGFPVHDLTYIMQEEPKHFNPDYSDTNKSIIKDIVEMIGE